MKIGIEAERANLPQRTGVEHYASELIRHLAAIDHNNQYVLYFRTKPQDWFYQLPSNFKLKVIPFPKFWTQLRISWEMLRHPVDVLLIPASALPLYHPKNSIVTIHDVAFEIFAPAFTPFMRNYLRWSSRFAVKHAKKVIAVSQSTKEDLTSSSRKELRQVYNADPAKIEVIYLGVSEIFKPRSYEQVQPVLDQWNLAYQKYILYVGTLQPRKNLDKLIEAYKILLQRYHVEEKLVIVGKKGWLWETIMEKIKDPELAGHLVFLDFVEAAALPPIYAGASLLTLVSLYEGFGLPPLEAMASGVPVVVSNVSSLPEVVGEAAVLVNPNSSEDIASGVLKVLSDASLRDSMIKKGFAQAAKFTWGNTARRTLKLFESLK